MDNKEIVIKQKQNEVKKANIKKPTLKAYDYDKKRKV